MLWLKVKNCDVCQDAHNSLVPARAALKYIVLALSRHIRSIKAKIFDKYPKHYHAALKYIVLLRIWVYG